MRNMFSVELKEAQLIEQPSIIRSVYSSTGLLRIYTQCTDAGTKLNAVQ